MSVTPMKLKTVSFQLPGGVQPRAATAPARATRHVATLLSQDRLPHRPTLSSATPSATGAVTSPTAKPDLIADLCSFEDSRTEKTWTAPTNSAHSVSRSPHPEMDEVVEMKEVLPRHGSQQSNASSVKGVQDRRASGQAKVSKAKVIKPHKTIPLSRRPSGLVTKMVHQMREQTNVSCLDYARWIKHDVAKLREHLVKLEDEIKVASKAKTTLDARIFELRKCLSVNQQSISAQQKKSHREVKSYFFSP